MGHSFQGCLVGHGRTGADAEGPAPLVTAAAKPFDSFRGDTINVQNVHDLSIEKRHLRYKNVNCV
jgi:hypothetical protein